MPHYFAEINKDEAVIIAHTLIANSLGDKHSFTVPNILPVCVQLRTKVQHWNMFVRHYPDNRKKNGYWFKLDPAAVADNKMAWGWFCHTLRAWLRNEELEHAMPAGSSYRKDDHEDSSSVEQRILDAEANAIADFTKKSDPRAIQIGGEHYKNLSVEPWAAMEAWLTREEYIGFLRGNIIKYHARANSGKEDKELQLKKAGHYQQELESYLSRLKRNSGGLI